MKRIINIYARVVAVMLCIALAAACSKIEKNELPYITFGVSGIDSNLNTDTKALITNETFTSNNVYVYGVRNNTIPIYNGTIITKDQSSNNWKASGDQIKWLQSSSYSFHGYTCSPASLANDASYNISNSGLKISVSQPSTYSEQDMVDYMLSHSYKVADGTNYHVVMLYMQHAMACVDIVVKKEMPEHVITLTGITLSKIFRSATMQCESQAIANSGENNVWTTSLSGVNDLSYNKNSFGEVQGNVLGKMSILAVPQQLYREATLSVVYSVNENGTPVNYTQEFKLFNYVPYVWESGHRITYTLTINTGVQLMADISDWKDAGYTEGIILPPSQGGSN